MRKKKIKIRTAYSIMHNGIEYCRIFPKKANGIDAYKQMFPWHKGYEIIKIKAVIPEAGKPSAHRDWVSAGMRADLSDKITNQL